jgi:hypothetical protein
MDADSIVPDGLIVTDWPVPPAVSPAAPENVIAASFTAVVPERFERSVFAESASAEFGMADAAAASEGVVVGFVIVGTNQEGHDPLGAAKLVTVPLPEAVTQVQFVPFHSNV